MDAEIRPGMTVFDTNGAAIGRVTSVTGADVTIAEDVEGRERPRTIPLADLEQTGGALRVRDRGIAQTLLQADAVALAAGAPITGATLNAEATDPGEVGSA